MKAPALIIAIFCSLISTNALAKPPIEVKQGNGALISAPGVLYSEGVGCCIGVMVHGRNAAGRVKLGLFHYEADQKQEKWLRFLNRVKDLDPRSLTVVVIGGQPGDATDLEGSGPELGEIIRSLERAGIRIKKLNYNPAGAVKLGDDDFVDLRVDEKGFYATIWHEDGPGIVKTIESFE